MSAPLSTPAELESDVAADPRRHGAVVAGDDLDLDPELGQLGDRRPGVGLRRVGEGEEPDQLAGRARPAGADRVGAVGGAGGHGDDPRALGEQPLEHAGGARRALGAAGEHRLGRALGDQQRAAAGRRRRPHDTSCRSWSKGRMPEPPVGVGSVGGRTRRRVWRRPQRLDPARCRPPGPASVRVASLHTRPSRSGSADGSPAASRAWSKVIAPSVSVPVLSVKSTWMLPRSSIVTSRLTSTFRRASSRDPAARLTLTMAGSSWGVMPIAIASENSSASMSGRASATLITKMETVSTAGHPYQQLGEILQPDLEGGVGRRRSQPDGDLAERRGRPRRDDHGARRALVHDVPMKAHDRPDRPASRCRAIGSLDFAAGIDSPVSTASSHSSCAVSSRRTSAGTTSPMPSEMTSPGHEVANVDRALARHPARPPPRGGCCACSAATARSDRYSLTNPSPTLSTTIAAMIAASVGSPVTPETGRRGDQQDQQRIAQLADEHAERRHPVGQQHVVAEPPQPLRGLRPGQPVVGRPEQLQHLGRREPGCAGQVERAGRRPCGQGVVDVGHAGQCSAIAA